jgi:hypothetical protein
MTLYRILVLPLLVLVALFLIAARSLQELPAGVLAFIGYALAVLLGGFGVKPIDWLKHVLNLEGTAALWLVLGVSVLVAGLAVYFGGALVGFTFDPEHVLAVFGVFFAAAYYVYRQLNPEPQT